MDKHREKVKSAFRQFVVDKIHVTFEEGVFNPVLDRIEESDGPLGVNFKIDIPLETVRALQRILRGED